MSDTSHWQDWQLEYLFGAFYVFPPRELSEVVNELRRRFDPVSHAYCDAHLSLTVPLPRPINQSGWEKLEASFDKIMPFNVSYGPPTSYPGVPGVVLGVKPVSTFTTLVNM